jgi:hypothetical protein
MVHVTAAHCLVVAVFCLDLVVPLGSEISFFYLLPVVFLALWSSPQQSLAVTGIAGFASSLMAVGFLLSLPENAWTGITNRAYALVVIAATVALSIVRKRAEEDVKVLHGLLPICSYCKKIRDDKGYWKQIEVYIAANSQADFSHGLCPECGLEHYPDIFKHQPTGTHS